jgi:UV DNA damage endonuclease
MLLAIGYACIALGVRDSSMRSCILKNASKERLDQIIAINLETLSRVLDYNISRRIALFRISSDIIPLGSRPINQNQWWYDHADTLQQLGEKIKKTGMCVSMHPGQYTVLNALDKNIAERAIADLEYHARSSNASLHKIGKTMVLLHYNIQPPKHNPLCNNEIRIRHKA